MEEDDNFMDELDSRDEHFTRVADDDIRMDGDEDDSEDDDE